MKNTEREDDSMLREWLITDPQHNNMSIKLKCRILIILMSIGQGLAISKII